MCAWITGRISKYDFIEDEDYKVCFPKRENKKGSGGHNTKDYSLTLDMAKELSMVENNKRSSEVHYPYKRVQRKISLS